MGFIPKIIPTFQTLSRHVTTDIDLTKMSELISKLPEMAEYKIVSIAMTDQNVLVNDKASTGQFILIPKIGENNWNEIHQFIENKGISTSSSNIKIINLIQYYVPHLVVG